MSQISPPFTDEMMNHPACERVVHEEGTDTVIAIDYLFPNSFSI
ncbi:hypothetical protein [Thermoactinomyces sp. DSM 45892]|nr:hypothetical protein [Thermoactinomyces sp. DSM 45892]SDY85819.1 hypothetical protein SAMN05444416_10991 [Thermoactinomyces sp. DSM 45892]